MTFKIRIAALLTLLFLGSSIAFSGKFVPPDQRYLLNLYIHEIDFGHLIFNKGDVKYFKKVVEDTIKNVCEASTYCRKVVTNYLDADIAVYATVDTFGDNYQLSLFFEDVKYKFFRENLSYIGDKDDIKSKLNERASKVLYNFILKIYNRNAKYRWHTARVIDILDSKSMVYIPAGAVTMGSPGNYKQLAKIPGAIWNHKDEIPFNKIKVKAFCMDRFEVTNYQWRRFILENPKWQKTNAPKSLVGEFYLYDWVGNNYPKGQDVYPVRYVSWYAAMAYAAWLEHTLPTESQWEYAAKAGNDNNVWSLGYKFDKSLYAFDLPTPLPVGFKKPNAFGLYDMSGNVAEWTITPYLSYPYQEYYDKISTEPLYFKYPKVVRGGSYAHFDRHIISTVNRMVAYPNVSRPDIGFRTVKAVPEGEPLPPECIKLN